MQPDIVAPDRAHIEAPRSTRSDADNAIASADHLVATFADRHFGSRRGHPTDGRHGRTAVDQEAHRSAVNARLNVEMPVDRLRNAQLPRLDDRRAGGFLVDSGATMTTIGRVTAARTEVLVSERRNQMVRTGNGIVRVATGRARSFDVGAIRRNDVGLHVADAEEFNVLGMNYLSSLKRWGVEGRWLILEG